MAAASDHRRWGIRLSVETSSLRALADATHDLQRTSIARALAPFLPTEAIETTKRAATFAVDVVFWLAAVIPLFAVCVLNKGLIGSRAIVIAVVSLATGWAVADQLLAQLPPLFIRAHTAVFPLFATFAWLSGAIVIGSLGKALSDEQRERASDVMGSVAMICFVVTVASGLALSAEWLVDLLKNWTLQILSGTTATGLIAAILSFRSRIGRLRPDGWRRYATHAATLAALAFAVTLWIAGSLAWTSIEPRLTTFLISPPSPRWGVVAIPTVTLLALAAWSWWWSQTIGLNTFSLNGLYRVRLTRTFLGGSSRSRDKQGDPFLRKVRTRPLHLINTVVNDPGTTHLEWRDRKASSFVLSPLYCGSDEVGFFPTKSFSDDEMTLGRAIAISGAAANPNMGHFSSKPVQWLMSFFNLRLGWWLRNPRNGDGDGNGATEPRYALTPFLDELLGGLGVDSRQLNLSDGGHFDNLGLYEAMRRECRSILAVDASYDPQRTHEDLARAERLIRIDFGAELRWQTTSAIGHYRVATIVYRGGATGRLVYVKPTLTGNEPIDVLTYAKQASEQGYVFPHEPTSDLWFDEAQFESYLKLGQHSAEAILEDARAAGRDDADLASVLAGLTLPKADLRAEKTADDTPGDPLLTPGVIAALPTHEPTGETRPWWKAIARPVAASVLASAGIVGGAEILRDRNSVEQRTDTVLTTRVATLIEPPRLSLLLPWFDEHRPSATEMSEWIPIIDKGLTVLKAEIASPSRTPGSRTNAPLLLADVARAERLTELLNESCRPIEIRGLASSSPIDVPAGRDTAEVKACGGPGEDSNEARLRLSDCLNVRLANRRASLMKAVLRKTGFVENDLHVHEWDQKNPSELLEAQFDDRLSGQRTVSDLRRQYLPARGVLNRSVEITPLRPGCDLEQIQRRLGIAVVDRPL